MLAPETKPGDIIEGPVVIPRPAEDGARRPGIACSPRATRT
jgi:hypothetical protein